MANPPPPPTLFISINAKHYAFFIMQGQVLCICNLWHESFIYFTENEANLEVDDCKEYLETSKHLASTLL